MTAAADELDGPRPPAVLTADPGWAAVVAAGVGEHDVRLTWVHAYHDHRPWVCSDMGEYDRNWADLIDPVLVQAPPALGPAGEVV